MASSSYRLFGGSHLPKWITPEAKFGAPKSGDPVPPRTTP